MQMSFAIKNELPNGGTGMKRRYAAAIWVICSLVLLLTASGCSSNIVKWDDRTIDLDLGGFPKYLSDTKEIYINEKGEEEIKEDCFIREYSMLPYRIGENTRFEMHQYGINMGMGRCYSEVYYFDGEKHRLIDSSGDLVFSDFALCDGERLCYLVSDGTLRVLEKDGGRRDYENAFDSNKITLSYHLEQIKFYAEGDTVFIEQYGYFGSGYDIKINDEEPIVRSSVEIEKSLPRTELSEEIYEKSRWSDEVCETFAVEGIDEIPNYIDRIKKTRTSTETVFRDGKQYNREEQVLDEGGYLVLDSVKCFSTGEEEGYAVKAYRFECDDIPAYYEVLRYQDGKMKLLDFSGDSVFGGGFLCDGERLWYIVNGNSRILNKDGGRIDDDLLKQRFD